MIFGRSIKWRDWRRHIATHCDVLTRGMTPPIPLQEVFARCRVKKVVFQPLLLEGGLAIDNDGFVIFANCEESSKETYQQAFDGIEQRGRHLPGRVRFTLAHELVHTFFYDTKQRPYTNWLTGKHAKEIESLESACNFGASHLLLPTKLLKSDTCKRDILTVDGIIDLAEKYQVSIECLINRLEHLEDWTPKPGLIALVRQAEDGYRVKAVAKSVAVRELFTLIDVDSEFEEAFGQTPFEIIKQQGNGTLDFDLTHPSGAGFGIAKCRIEYRRNNSQTFVLALSVDGVTKPTTEHKYSNDTNHHIAKLRETIKQRSASKSDRSAAL